MSTSLPSPPAPTAPPDFAALDDRALDAALAVALFGAAEIVYHPCWYDGECGDLHAEGDHAHPFFEGLLRGREDAELHPCTVRYAGGPYPYEPVPRYSADASAALAVVEAMNDPERAGRVYNVVAMRTWYGWAVTFRVGFDTPPFDTLDGWTTAKTFPRAVALAALRALAENDALPPSALALLASPGA